MTNQSQRSISDTDHLKVTTETFWQLRQFSKMYPNFNHVPGGFHRYAGSFQYNVFLSEQTSLVRMTWFECISTGSVSIDWRSIIGIGNVMNTIKIAGRCQKHIPVYNNYQMISWVICLQLRRGLLARFWRLIWRLI